MSPAVSAVPSSVFTYPSVPAPSGVLASLSMPALGPVRLVTGDATYVVSPQLMAAMVMEPLRVLDLPPSDNEIDAFLVV